MANSYVVSTVEELQQAIEEAKQDPNSPDDISFAEELAGTTLYLDEPLLLNGNITIEGDIPNQGQDGGPDVAISTRTQPGDFSTYKPYAFRLTGGNNQLKHLAFYNEFQETASSNELIAVHIQKEGNGNLIDGCYFGLDLSGRSIYPNANVDADRGGIVIQGAKTIVQNCIIGGYQDAENAENFGILITGVNAKENVIKGNYIGATLDGALVENVIGVLVEEGAEGNVIGTPEVGGENVIALGRAGIGLVDDIKTTILNNYIGVSVDGTKELVGGNKEAGIYIREASIATKIGNNTYEGANSILGVPSGIYFTGNPESGVFPDEAEINGNFFGTVKFADFPPFGRVVGIESGVVSDGATNLTIKGNVFDNLQLSGVYLDGNYNPIVGTEVSGNIFTAQSVEVQFIGFNSTVNGNIEFPEISKVDGLTIEGSARPNARIQVYNYSSPNSQNPFAGYLEGRDVVADASGKFTFTVSQDELDNGTIDRHFAFLQDELVDGRYNTSTFSEVVTLCPGFDKIIIADVVENPTIVCSNEITLEVVDPNQRYTFNTTWKKANSLNEGISIFSVTGSSFATVSTSERVAGELIQVNVSGNGNSEGCSTDLEIGLDFLNFPIDINGPDEEFVTTPDITLTAVDYQETYAQAGFGFDDFWLVPDLGPTTTVNEVSESPSTVEIKNLNVGDNYIVHNIVLDGAQCQYFDTVNYIYLVEDIPVDAGEDILWCGDYRDNFTMNASYAGVGKIGEWSSKDGNIFFPNQNDINNPKAEIFGAYQGGTYTLYWTIYDEGTGDSLTSDSIVITNLQAEDFGPYNISVCEEPTIAVEILLSPAFQTLPFTKVWTLDPSNESTVQIDKIEASLDGQADQRAIISGFSPDSSNTVIFTATYQDCQVIRRRTVVSNSNLPFTADIKGESNITVDNDVTSTEILVRIDDGGLYDEIQLDALSANVFSSENTSVVTSKKNSRTYLINVNDLQLGENIFEISFSREGSIGDDFIGGGPNCFDSRQVRIVRRLIKQEVGNQKRCGDAPFTLSHDKLLAGQTGEWLIDAMPTGANVQFVGSSNESTVSIQVDKTGDYEFIWALTQDGFTDYDTVQVAVSLSPENFYAHPTEDTLYIVEKNKIQLNGSVHSGTWTSLQPSVRFDGNATKTSSRLPNATAENLAYGYTTLIWTADGLCTLRDTLTVGRLYEASAGEDQQLCIDNTILSANTTDAKSTGTWTTVNPGDVIIDSPNDPFSLVTFTREGTYELTWTVVSNSDPTLTNSDKVEIVVSKLAPVNAGPNYFTNFSEIDLTTASTVINDGLVNFTWESSNPEVIISSPTNLIPRITFLQEGDNVFKLKDNDPNCPSEDSVVVTYTRQLDLGEEEVTLCLGENSQEIKLENIQTPQATSYNWYQVNGGTGAGSVIISNNTDLSPTFSVNSGEEGSYNMVLQVSNGNNEFDYDTIQMSFVADVSFEYIGDLQVTGDTANLQVQNSDNTALQYIGQWTSEGQLFFDDENSMTTVVRGLEFGANNLIWAYTEDLNCVKEVSVEIEKILTAEISEGDSLVVCQGETIVLNGLTNALNFDFVEWIDIANNSLGTAPILTYSVTTSGTYEFVYRVGTSNAGTATDTIKIIVQPFEEASVFVFSPIVYTDEVDLQSDNTISGEWSSFDFSLAFENPFAPNTKVSNLQIGPNDIVWRTGIDTGCIDDALITIFRELEVNAGKDTSGLCSPEYTMTADSINGFTGTWTVLTTDSDVTIENPNKANTKVTFGASGTVEFAWTFNENGFQFTDNVVISVEDVEKANAGLTITTDQDFAELESIGDNDDIEWVVEKGTGVISDLSSIQTTVTGLSDGENLVVLLDKDNCPTSDTLKIVYTDKIFIANLDTFKIDEDENKALYDVLGNDIPYTGEQTDTTTLEIIETDIPSTSGTASVVNGQIEYKPLKNFFGKDSLLYQVCGTGGACDVAYVVFEISPVDDKIVATNDTITTDEETEISFDVTLNDFDIDGTIDISSLEIIQDPLQSILVNFTDGKLVYTPKDNFVGSDFLTYKVCSVSPNTVCDTATVYITVNNVDDAIEAVNDEGTTSQDLEVRIDVLANDFDV
ncbi:MAG: hypothetical protein GY827_01640, partial [Cytophagales bacterium]|nr:hypothetical protein [Cytophagales bacterium]